MKPKVQDAFRVGIIKPGKRIVARIPIKATDRAWRTAIFGLGGSSKRIGGVQIGNIDGQPLAVIGELPEEVDHDLPHWAIETDQGLWAFIGPCAIYNDAGYGPATLGLTADRLRELVQFDLDPEVMQEGLRRTLQKRVPPPEAEGTLQ